MKFTVRLDKRTCKVLDRMPSDVRHRVVRKLESLEDDPRPPGAVKLVGVEGLYRVRVGDWQLFTRFVTVKLVVVVIRIGHRREVYR